MATDIEKLVVQMSADFKAYEREMRKVSGITSTEMKKIRADATGTGNSSVVAFTGAARGVRSYGVAAAAAARQSGSLRAQTANLGAQFQDIAVQLQSGASPLTIALQQGTQISAVLGTAPGGAAGAVKALGGAFASLLSPVSLITIGLIAAGGAAVQYFSGLLGDGEKSADELKKQSDLIRQVAKDWGDAVPAIAAYADELDRAARSADVLSAAQGVQEGITQRFQEQFRGLADSVKDTIAFIPDAQQAFGILSGKIEEGTATSEDFERVIAALAAVMGDETVPALQEAIAALSQMQGQAAAAATQIANVGNQAAAAAGKVRDFAAAQAMRDSTRAVLQGQSDFIAEQERLNGLSKEQLDLEKEIASVKRDAKDAGTVIDEGTAGRLAAERLAAESARSSASRGARSSGGGGGSSAASEVDREREAVTKLVEQLQFEQSLIGMTAVEKEKANALRRAGAAATAEERAQIEQLVVQNYSLAEAIKADEEAMNRLKSISKDVLGGMFEDLRDGASAAEILSNALNRVAESLVKAGIDNLIDAVFKPGGGAGGGLLGGAIIPGILHSGGVAGRDGYGHGRSVSPAVFAGAPRYHNGGIAGLRAGEVPAILQKGERVIPKGQSGGAVDVRVFVDQDGNWRAAVANIAGPVSARAVQRLAPSTVANASRRVG